MSTTTQNFNRVTTHWIINLFNNVPDERAKTAKGLGSN
jgi:hypothetical protein